MGSKIRTFQTVIINVYTDSKVKLFIKYKNAKQRHASVSEHICIAFLNDNFT